MSIIKSNIRNVVYKLRTNESVIIKTKKHYYIIYHSSESDILYNLAYKIFYSDKNGNKYNECHINIDELENEKITQIIF